MRKTLIVCSFIVGACSQSSPLAPTPITPVRAQHAALELVDRGRSVHGLPVGLDLPGFDGQVGWVCATQPREYCGPDGCTTEIDHYVQLGACPAEPIQ